MTMPMNDEDFNAQGTFYFPVGFRNETQYIAFWVAVVVPDSALAALLNEQVPHEHANNRKLLDMKRSSARSTRRSLLQTPGAAHSEEIKRVLQDLQSKQQARLRELEIEIQKLEQELAKLGPGDPEEILSPVPARPVARATGLVAYLPAGLDGASRDRILGREFELGDGRWMSARDIVDRFETLELSFLRAPRG
ncbi:hypothetical protein GL325_05970 [Aeromicrobium sp. 636]|uniref:Uncharacterized protein n=1 Tax=Aeromicrobium senzhongii TaxID=2663859 RepID=A0A8I0K011_9ACTN|nr:MULTISPECIES: hypothetical protein [Aeromicrobium]MBC9225861.1 hypothetical protein [Aeromicrobium senzhongii]MCQ3997968.1 hypothetical protein [Aeromicrobium sp. 636]